MNRISWLLSVRTSRWVEVLLAAAGLLSTTAAVTTLLSGAYHLGTVANLAAGLAMCAYVAYALRWRRRHGSLVQARAAFRATVRALPRYPTIHVNEGAGLVFVRFAGWAPLYRWNILARVADYDVDEVLDALELGEEPIVIADEFEIRSGFGEVFASINGTRLRTTADGDVDESELTPSLGRWSAVRGRYRGLAAGLLRASEDELRQVCAQLAASTPVSPTAADD